MKSHFIAWILLFVFAATVFNILYLRRPVPKIAQNTGSFLLHYVEPVDAGLCSVRGFKCRDADCDCETVCGCGGYEKIAVLPGEEVIMHDARLAPGTYCVPKGFDTCHQKSSVFVYSASGWFCAPRNTAIWNGNRMIACKNSRAMDDSKNVLMDRVTGKEVDHLVKDFYELLPDGSPRYRCECGSLDERGNAMLATLPFMCSEDFCLREMNDMPTLYGWKGDRCECGTYPHADPDDHSSPCAREVTGVTEDNRGKMLTGRVNCMHEKSYTLEPIICSGDQMLYFEKRIGSNSHPPKFMEDNIKFFERQIENI